MDVISMGEMVIDFLPGTEPASYLRNAGGAPANMAIAAARNGLSAGMYCRVGDDDFGRFLLKTLEDNGVKPLLPELCETVFTTMAFVSLNENNDRSFSFCRKPGADTQIAPSDIKDSDIEGCSLVHAGSVSLSGHPSDDATRHFLKKAKEMQKLVSFDVNYRDLVWNEDRQKCIDSVQEIFKYVDFLKISDEEEDMVGGVGNIAGLMEKEGISLIVETLGAEGARCFYKGKEIRSKGYSFGAVADTTGAGDAFWGAFVSRLLILGVRKVSDITEEIIKDALDYGNISGSLCVTKKGAISSLPTREKIEEIREKQD